MNLLRYGGIYMLTALLAAAALYALSLTGIRIPGSGMSVVPVLVAAMNEGRVYATAYRALPEKSAVWRFSVLAMLVGLIPQAVVAGVALTLYPDVARSLASSTQSGTFWLLILLVIFVCAVTILANKLFLSMGAKNALKVLSKP